MTAPAVPTPGDLARRNGIAPPVPAPASTQETPAVAVERPTPPRPMYVPRELTVEESIAPGVLTDTEYFRNVYRWGLMHSGLPSHARLLAYDLLLRANHKSGRLGSAHQPDIEHLATATGLTQMQVGVALQVLSTRGWIAYRPDTGTSTRQLYDLVIPALALEQVRGRRYLQLRQQERALS